MPTYDYVCDACGHAFEHRQSMSSNRLRTCPECKKRKLRRLIGSGAGVIFKGSGFYETDYKRKSRGKPGDNSDRTSKESQSSDGDSSSGKSTETKSDAEPASSGADTSTSKKPKTPKKKDS